MLFVVRLFAMSAHAAFEGAEHDHDCGVCDALAAISVPLLTFVIVLLAAAAQQRRRWPALVPVLSFEQRRIAAPRGPPVL